TGGRGRILRAIENNSRSGIPAGRADPLCSLRRAASPADEDRGPADRRRGPGMSSIEIESGALVDRVRLGDERALAALSQKERDRLWRMVRARLDPRLRGRVDPDDILQEAYLDATRRIAHFASEGSMSFFLWL